MQEQFIIVKHGASFQVNHNTDQLTIKALQPGRLYPEICNYIAMSQLSIAQFYLAEQKWKRMPLSSLTTFFQKKGWQVQNVTKKAALTAA